MAVPLLAKGELKGVLFLDTRERTNAFSEKDLKILSGIASQAAIALENADLAQKIEAEAVTRAELSRFLSPAVADMVVKGQVELLAAGPAGRGQRAVRRHPRLHLHVREREPAGDGVDAERLLHGDGRRGVPARGQPRQVHRRLRDGGVGSAVAAPRRPGARAAGGAGDAGRGGGAQRGPRGETGRSASQVGIGVNTGQAVVGYMGSADRHEFTAIGDS